MALPALPNELIRQICEQIPDRPSLASLACTCRALQAPAEIYLYNTIAFTKRAPQVRLHDALEHDPQRRDHIHSLELLYASNEYDYADTPPVNITALPNLESLFLESPFTRLHKAHPWEHKHVWTADMKAYLAMLDTASLLRVSPQGALSLTNLKSLTLHWNSAWGGAFWTITPSCPVFLIPSLKYLRLSVVHVLPSEDDAVLDRFAGQMDLETLTFVVSYVDPAALERILSFPRALKALTWHETTYSGTTTSPWVAGGLDRQLQSLRQQSENLQSLDIAYNILDPSVFRMDGPDGFQSLDLSEFCSLNHLQFYEHHRPLVRPPPALRSVRLDFHAGHALFDIREAVGKIALGLKLDECLANCAVRREAFQLDLRLICPKDDEDCVPIIPLVRKLKRSIRDRCARVLWECSVLGYSSDIDMARRLSPGSPQFVPSFVLRIQTATLVVDGTPLYLFVKDRRHWRVRYESDIFRQPYDDAKLEAAVGSEFDDW